MKTVAVPLPRAMLGWRNADWTIHGAVAELIDNSFGIGRGHANQVEITYNKRTRVLEILDDGVGVEDLIRLFQVGNTGGSVAGDIGYYGQGGSNALIWLASKVDVFTLRDKKVANVTVDWDWQLANEEYPDVPTKWKTATVANTPESLWQKKHGTLIRLHLSKERIFYAESLQQHIAEMFGPGIRNGKVIIWRTVKGEEVNEIALTDPIPALSDPIKFDIEIDADGQQLHAKGEVGYNELLPVTKSKIAIGYGSRVILRTNECYRSDEETFSGTGVTGWLDLGEGFQPYMTTTKTGFNDANLRKALMGFIFENIRPLLQKLKDAQHAEIFADLGINLSLALQGAAKVTVKKKVVDGDDLGIFPDGPPNDVNGPGPVGPDPKNKTFKEAEDGTERSVKTPGLTKIEFETQSDEIMGGVLCRAEVIGETGIAAHVNKEHKLVQAALDQKPLNRMFLNYVVMNEVSRAVTQNKMLERIFPKATVIELDKIDDTSERERKVTRLLLDAVRDRRGEEPPPPPMEAAAA